MYTLALAVMPASKAKKKRIVFMIVIVNWFLIVHPNTGTYRLPPARHCRYNTQEYFLHGKPLFFVWHNLLLSATGKGKEEFFS
jgi:hypothetical protein